jgi:hypothetical protein
MQKTENILSFMAKIDEFKEEFKRDFNYNKFENKLTIAMNQYLSTPTWRSQNQTRCFWAHQIKP